MQNKKLAITDVALRDAHQSLFATRLRLEDMLPIAPKLDEVGYWSLETWGGATFDSCIRYLGEDPWDRIRQLKKAMPKTPQQMLLRAQNLLGYRHYADDVVDKFVETAAKNGVDVFRVFDAMNDPRNFKQAIAAVKATGKHAQAAMSYTTSPVHTLQAWLDLAKRLEDFGADSICIKDMAGILTPYTGFELVTKLKQQTNLDIHLHAHATAGLSDMTILKCVEAGIDRVDTGISSMSLTYGHTSTESLVAALQGTERDTGLNLQLLEEIAAYFREVRKKYAKFEGSLRGTDSRILVAQVPGGMLTNMENQLREQNAADKFDAVLKEIPEVRKDLGYIPLVTPTSQIVGTQAVLNVLSGERYKNISKETQAILRGEYGAAPAEFNKELQARVLDGDQPISCRPADKIENEMQKLTEELQKIAKEEGISLSENLAEDVLIYALFQQIGLKFLKNRNNPDVFEPKPSAGDIASNTGASSTSSAGKNGDSAVYTVKVNNAAYVVEVSEGGDISQISAPQAIVQPQANNQPQATNTNGALANIEAPLAGNIFKLMVNVGDEIEEGEIILIMEAMKMETEIRSDKTGVVASIEVKEGDAVQVGDALVKLQEA